MTRWLALACAIGLLGCDGTSSPSDAGGTDAGELDGGNGTTFTYAFVLRGSDTLGADLGPIAGAFVVIR